MVHKLIRPKFKWLRRSLFFHILSLVSSGCVGACFKLLSSVGVCTQKFKCYYEEYLHKRTDGSTALLLGSLGLFLFFGSGFGIFLDIAAGRIRWGCGGFFWT